MRLAPPPLAVGDRDGFKDDIFRAKEAGERLAALVRSLESHSVIVLDGGWGTGKTTFVRQWAGLMRIRGHPVIYLDAFRSDHHADAFLAMVAEVVSCLKKLGFKDFKALSKAAIAVAKATPHILAHFLPAPMLPVAAITRQVLRGWLPTRCRKLDKRTASLEGFRKKLTKAVAKTTSDSSKKPGARPLVFIIDELDRCKPSFALNVLERMKHIFSVEGICFVLVTHLDELAKMVKHAYGLEKPQTYLDKFYHLRVDIDSVLSFGKVDRVERYLQHLADSMASSVLDDKSAIVTLKELAAIHDLSLRSLERVALGLTLYDHTADDVVASSVNLSEHQGPNATAHDGRGHQHPTLLDNHATSLVASMCVLRVHDADTYRTAAGGQLTWSIAKRFLKLDHWKDRTAAEELTPLWKLVTSAPAYEPDPGYATSSIHYPSILPDICRLIDLFWPDDDTLLIE